MIREVGVCSGGMAGGSSTDPEFAMVPGVDDCSGGIADGSSLGFDFEVSSSPAIAS
jgi:hypothetical protein